MKKFIFKLLIILFLYFLQLWTLLFTLLPINNALKTARKEHKKNQYIDEVN